MGNTRRREVIEGTIIKKAFPVPSNYVLKLVFSFFVIGWLLIVCPKRVMKFYRLQKEDGLSVFPIIQSIYINAHILPYNLDWLHFGFATMGIKRENVARAINAKSAVSLRGFGISVYPLKHPGCYDLLWKRTDKVHVISDDLIKKMKITGSGSSPEVHKITPSIKVSDFIQKQNNGRFHTPVKILSVGRLHWIKGFEYGMEAMARLKNDFKINFHWTIVGSGVEYERLKFAAYQLDLENNITFKGNISHNEVSLEMLSTDIYMQPSIHEGFCNAVLEAQASGCFCIVTNGGGLNENVIDKKTGIVVPKRNPAAMAGTIANAVKMSEEERQIVIEAAGQRIKNEFTIERQIEKFDKFYSNA
ncbi:glycosyltransferase family 4 protein [Marinilabilia salmonicolor]|uniref:glycosyltransferase family 4 protein n=1 Tax=Marinilabilia salmonicolor TaxID=989 RepID=UPI0012F6DF9D|nr:glycosyltransferase family 4 protein [Marinilabilia salmonicolor]